MKQITLLLLILVSIAVSVQGQFKVEIGNDTTYCYQNFKNGIELSPHLKIENGTPPYTYIWETYWEAEVPFIKKNVFTASDFLNDTTLSNPIFKERANNILGPSNWVQFVLKVTDNNKNVAIDGIRIRVSIIADVPPMEYRTEIHINEGDSIWMDGANDYMGIKPYQKYIWEPITGMSNPDSAQTGCKPIKEEGYKFSVIDSVGCQSVPFPLYYIHFNPTTLDQLIETNQQVYQQKRIIYWANESGLPTRLSFYDLSGKLLHSEVVTGNQYEPDDFFPSSGIYPCVIENKNGKSQLKYQWFPN